jgi:hypothetical protein
VLGGESFVALAEGLQNALWALGRAPLQHRSDSLPAAFRNLDEDTARPGAPLRSAVRPLLHALRSPDHRRGQGRISTARAYRIEQDPRLPSQKKMPRGRRRQDPLAAVWDSEAVPLLKSTLGLRLVTIFDEIRRRHPKNGAGVRRTLERRVRSWRALNAAEQDVRTYRGQSGRC